MVCAFIIHVISAESTKIVYQRYFCQENTEELLSAGSETSSIKIKGTQDQCKGLALSPGVSTSLGSYGTDHEQSPLRGERWSRSASPANVPALASGPRGLGHGNETSANVKELIIKRRQQSQNVAEYVQSEYLFRKALTGRTVEEDMSRLNNEDTLPEFEMGFLRLPAGEPYRTEKITLWQASANCCFTFVLEKHENRNVAENVLKRLIGFLQENFRVLHQPSEALLKVDRVDLILDRYLPGGQLLFMNNRFSRQLEKQIDQVMKT